MFTGLVEETGSIAAVRRANGGIELTIRAHAVAEGTRVGDSVAVNGVCLTVTRIMGTALSFDVMGKTLERSTIRSLTSGMRVNLERALAAGRRFGGHMMSGHVDGTGRIEQVMRDGIASIISVSVDPEILNRIVLKGSVAVDGVSLTVCVLGPRSFAVSVIPHTASQTTLGSLRAGMHVNIECDAITKMLGVFRSGETARPAKKLPSALDENFLREHGFMEG